jgi:glutamine amidotransferase-like uncharacterized protein
MARGFGYNGEMRLMRAALCALTLTSPAFAAKRLALVYRGPGTCEDCAEPAALALLASGWTVEYVQPNGLTPENLARADLYLQPGGDDNTEVTVQAMTPAQLESLRAYVSGGGRYLGVCAGGYLAGLWADDAKKIPGFRLVDLDVGPEISSPTARVLPVIWGGKEYPFYYQFGPYFDFSKSALKDKAEIVARFARTGHAAAVIVPVGKGRVGLVGPHPEATPAWYADDHLPAPTSSNWPLFDDFVARLTAGRRP